MKKLTIQLTRNVYNTVSQDIRDLGNSMLDAGWADTLSWMHSREAPASIQFLKYVVCGFAATAVQLVLVIAMGMSLFPAFEGLVGHPIPVEEREFNLIVANLIAFPFANLVAYILNVLWVFTVGRHSRWKEFWLFTAVSSFSFGVGLFGGPLLIGWFGIPSWSAQVGFMVTSAMVNYVCRKFLIFLK